MVIKTNQTKTYYDKTVITIFHQDKRIQMRNRHFNLEFIFYMGFQVSTAQAYLTKDINDVEVF